MNKEINLLVHGPFSGNAYEEILLSLRNSVFKTFINKIVFSIYKDDEEKTKQFILSYSKEKDFNIEFVMSEDVFNPGFFNINRQINLVSRGLAKIEKNSFVIKLRNDQWIDFDKFSGVVKEVEGMRKLMTTNCFTRKDRLYHPSDMFLAGNHELLELYYRAPFFARTHTDIEKTLGNSGYSLYEFEKNFLPPEAYLFREYLKSNNWEIKNTFADSERSLKCFFYLVNSWNIGLRWKKQRNPRLPPGSIILPYTFSVSPFPGAPVEHARCYSEGDFTGKKTITDQVYLLFARLLFLVRPPFRRRAFFLLRQKIHNLPSNSLRRKIFFSSKTSLIRNFAIKNLLK